MGPVPRPTIIAGNLPTYPACSTPLNSTLHVANSSSSAQSRDLALTAIHSSRDRGRYSPPESSHSMSLIPEISTYPQSRYDAPYSNDGHHTGQHPSRHTLAASSVRSTMGHPSMQQWSPPPILSPEPYVSSRAHFNPARLLTVVLVSPPGETSSPFR